MKSESGPPITLGNAAAARVGPIVWCRDCSHQVEPDSAGNGTALWPGMGKSIAGGAAAWHAGAPRN